MNTSSFRKTVMATAVAGSLLSGGIAQADVVNFSWSGAFTILNPIGGPIRNLNSDYVYGRYANNDGYANTGDAPTMHGWVGYRTPVSGGLSFDITNGTGVATLTPFQFFGDTPGTVRPPIRPAPWA